MGPGVHVDPARTRGIVDELEEASRARTVLLTLPVAEDSR